MEILYLAYANSQEHPLPQLQAEADEVYGALLPRALDKHYFPHRDAYSSIRKIAEFLALYRRRLAVFSFSGHAGQDALFLGGEAARAFGIAQLLGECPNLKLVLLNGCSTQAQAALLRQKGVPVVIATSAPVADTKARRFAARLFQALAERNTLGEAVNLAVGEVQAMADVTFLRKLDLDDDPAEVTEARWLMYYSDEADLLYRLPEKVVPAAPDFAPNELLIRTLWESLPRYNAELAAMAAAENGGAPEILKKRQALLNNIPAPVAENLRKMVVPIDEENEGYDKISEARLRQIDRTFQSMLEMLAFALLAQIWKTHWDGEAGDLPETHRNTLLSFIGLNAEARAVFDFGDLIRAAEACLDQQSETAKTGFFIEEFRTARVLVYEEGAFSAALFFLNTLRQRLAMGGLASGDIANWCIEGEEALAVFLSHLGFIARYTLATIQSIDVLKFQHLRVPEYRHELVYLLDLLGGLEKSESIQKSPLFNRSVLLMKEDDNGEAPEALNLSPFIIDSKAFADAAAEERNADKISNIYFFSHYDAASDTYCYKYVKKPEDPYLRAGANGRYSVVYDQWKAFEHLLKTGAHE